MAKKPAESPAAAPSRSSTEPEQLSSVLTSLGALRPQYSVRVYEINDEGNPQARGKFTADKCDEFVIAERYGGGEYRADVVDARGMIHRQVRVYVPADVVAAAPEPAPPPAPAARTDDLAAFKSAILAEVRDALRASAPAPAASHGLDAAGLAALMTAIQSPLVTIFGRQLAAPTTPVGELIDGMTKLRKLSGLGAAEEADDDGELPEVPGGLSIEETFIREMVSLGREFVALQREKRGAKSPAPKRVENEAQRPDAAASKPAKRSACERLAILVGTNAAAEIDPQLCAQAVAFFVGSNQAELRAQFDFAKPLAAQLIDKAPGLKAHAEYIASVEAAVRAMAAGAAGNDQDEDEDDGQDDTSTGAEAGGDQTGSNA